MPTRAPKICGCGHKIAAGETCACQRSREAARQKARPSAAARGYDSKWQRESRAYLAEPQNRLCACGCGKPANVVDHKVAHKGDQKLFWSRSNWQPMNRGCNSRKAAKGEGRWRRPKCA